MYEVVMGIRSKNATDKIGSSSSPDSIALTIYRITITVTGTISAKYALRYNLFVNVVSLCSCPIYNPNITNANPIKNAIIVRYSAIRLPCLDWFKRSIILSRRSVIALLL